jgi:RHS repeat-associated protein
MKRHFTLFTLIAISNLLCIKAYSQEYSYDVNGNLSKDVNKQIQSIHYNYLNLADTIVYSDGRKIIYMYTASGEKLQEKVIQPNGAIIKKADYINEFLYNRDTLRQIRQGYGRVVPVNVGDHNSAWEYQYEQKDQVGNVRTLLTSRPDADSDKGTFETANMNAEQNQFQRYEDVRKINSILFDHTNKGATHYSERLNGSAGEKYGLAKSLSVMAGDVINLEVYAKYIDPDAGHWTSALLPLVTQIAKGASAAGTVLDGSGYAASGNTPFALAGLNGTTASSGKGPKAYLNWLVFDRNFVFKNGGYVQMKGEAKENGTNVAHEKLSTQLVIAEAGYVYAYLSNEEVTPLDVFFDDFSVELVKGPVIQQTDYDPFGLVTDESIRENSVQNDFLYNGKELQKDFDLNWYDYGARMYDAALGRWHVIDPMAEKYSEWSPYNYVTNNPIRFVDPDGREFLVAGRSKEEDDRIQNVLEELKKIPVVQDAIKKIEESKRLATISVSSDGGESVEIFDKNAATGKGQKGNLGVDKVEGTGEGSDVLFEISPNDLSRSQKDLTVALLGDFAQIFTAITGTINVKQYTVKVDRGQEGFFDGRKTTQVSANVFQKLNFENFVRVYKGLPLKRQVLSGITVIDKRGTPHKGL